MNVDERYLTLFYLTNFQHATAMAGRVKVCQWLQKLVIYQIVKL